MKKSSKTQDAKRIIFINGKSLYLRPPHSTDDLSLLVRWFNDPEIRAFINRRNSMSHEAERKFLEQHAEMKDNILLIIVLKGKTAEQDRAIGTIGIHGIERESGVAMTGAAIGEKDCWKQGYGTEAKMIFLEYIFNNLNLRKIYSHVLDTNPRSRAYSEKCGYELEATLPRHHFLEGRYVDLHILAVYADVWRALWEKTKRKYLPT